MSYKLCSIEYSSVEVSGALRYISKDVGINSLIELHTTFVIYGGPNVVRRRETRRQMK
jgi:hypothetical protein